MRATDIHEFQQAARQGTRRGATTNRHSTTAEAACPRCSGRLLYDGDKLSCLACGHEQASPVRLLRNPGDLLDALPSLQADLIGHTDSLGARPESGSPGNLELRGASEAEAAALDYARLYAHQCLTSAGHALIALARGLEPPAPEYGTWSIARSILDASSLVSWLLEPNLPRRERASRALAAQLADLDDESSFLAALLAERPGRTDADGFTDLQASIRVRRQELLSLRAEFGAQQAVPAPAERAPLLHAEFDRLMCSSLGSGRPWALLIATTIHADRLADRVRSILETQVQLSAIWYGRAVWTYASWMSRESLPELQSSLERGYDSLGLPDEAETRFWRRPRSVRQRARAAG